MLQSQNIPDIRFLLYSIVTVLRQVFFMTYAKSKEMIQGILEVALALFTEKNYADVTINDIVTSANISKGAVYHHFSNKQDVYLSMMYHYLAEIQKITQHTTETSTGPCRERLR